MEPAYFTRLYDVLFSGPIYIYFSTFIPNSKSFLKLFVFLTGIFAIIYNGHNWLFIEKRWLQRPLLPNFLIDFQYGKTQPHRLFNLIVMYPILLWSNFITKKPLWLTYLLYSIIALGILGNFYYYVSYVGGAEPLLGPPQFAVCFW